MLSMLFQKGQSRQKGIRRSTARFGRLRFSQSLLQEVLHLPAGVAAVGAEVVEHGFLGELAVSQSILSITASSLQEVHLQAAN